MADSIKFLGTAGARFAVYRQLRSSGGIWCSFQGEEIFIDPGPGTMVRCASSRPRLNPEKLDAVILTHRHLDHSTDINVIIEAMTRGTFQRRGKVFLPSDALDFEPVVYGYLRNSVEEVVLLRESGSYQVGDISFSTPVRHLHSVETYGVKFNLPYGKIAFIADTLFFKELTDHYRADILVINVLLYDPPSARGVQHLDLGSVREIIVTMKPSVTVMTHFGMSMLDRKPWLVAQRLSEETGLKVVAARDGMILYPEEHI